MMLSTVIIFCSLCVVGEEKGGPDPPAYTGSRLQLYSGGNVYLPRKKRELCHSLAIVKFIAMVIFKVMAISVLTMVITHCMLPSKSADLETHSRTPSSIIIKLEEKILKTNLKW